jgi:hypothetical protein
MEEELTLEDFQRWKVPQLKEYLKKRGLKTSARKDELCSLAFAAHKVSVTAECLHKFIYFSN